MIDPNLIYFKHLATSNETDNSLSVNGKNQIIPTKGHQTGNDLVKVIQAVQDAVNSAKDLDLKVTKIDLNGIEQNLKQRVEEFKKSQIARLDSLGYRPTDDKSLQSALDTLTALIAQKKIVYSKPTYVEMPLPAPAKESNSTFVPKKPS